MAMATLAPDPMQTISVGHWRSVLGDAPHSLLTSAAFVIIREVCSSDGELVPHVLLHTTDRRTYLKGVSSYFGLGLYAPRFCLICNDQGLYSLSDDDSFSSLVEIPGLRGIKFLKGAFGKGSKSPFIALLGHDGKVWTVGRNDRSQLGHHSRQDQTEFCMVQAVYNVVDLAVGVGHCLAVTRMSQVFAWGDNAFGQVGIGSVGGVVEKPTKVLEGCDDKGKKAALQLKQVAASWNRSLVLTRSGKLFVWGNNQDYQPNLFTVPNIRCDRFSQISCGKDHYLALFTDGRVCVWGRNDRSQLGLGHKLDVEVPKVVDISARVVSVLAVGQTSSARTSHGALFFWGRHLSQDICHPRKSRLFPHPRDILVHGEEIDSGGSVTLDYSAFGMPGESGDDRKGSDTTDALRNEIASLRSDVQGCKKNYEALQKKFHESESETADLKAKLKSIQLDYDNLGVQHKELQSKYEKEAAETKKMKSTLQDLSSAKEGGKAGTDVQFGRKLKLLEETLDEILNVCDVIGTEQRSMKAKMTSLQVQMDSAGVSRPVTVRQSIAGLRRKLHTHVADAMPDKKESSPVTQESSANAAITSPTTRRDVDREEHLEDSDCDSDCTYVSL